MIYEWGRGVKFLLGLVVGVMTFFQHLQCNVASKGCNKGWWGQNLKLAEMIL